MAIWAVTPCLAVIGKRMREVLRGSDLKCRYAGEQFLVLLPETPLAGAKRVAETLRREVADRPVPVGRREPSCDRQLRAGAGAARRSQRPGPDRPCGSRLVSCERRRRQLRAHRRCHRAAARRRSAVSVERLAWIAWITVCVVWGTTYLAIRVALETVPVLLVAGLRWLSAGVVLGLFAVGHRPPAARPTAVGRPGPPRLSDERRRQRLRGVGRTVRDERPDRRADRVRAVLERGHRGLPAGRRARALGRRSPGLPSALPASWCWCGRSCRQAASAGRQFVGGVIGIQLACFGWALGTSFIKRHPSSGDPLAATSIQMVCSGTMLLALATAGGEWAALRFTPRTLIAMTYLTVAGSVVAYTAYIYAVRICRSPRCRCTRM